MQPEQIAERCARVGLRRKALAALAGLDETTVERTLNRKTRPLYETVDKLGEALRGYELATLRHLARLYPQEAVAACCPERGDAA